MSEIYEYYRNTEKNLEKQRISDIERKNREKRERLLAQLELKGIEIKDYYNEDELLALYEFGDARAIHQKEYSDKRKIFSDGKTITDGTAELENDEQAQRIRDLELALKLGGPLLRSSMRKAIRSADSALAKRKGHIKTILKELPEQYKVIKRHVLINDINRLAEFCKKYYVQSLRILMVPFIQRRILEFGPKIGLLRTIKEVGRDMNVDISGWQAYDLELMNEGFYSKKIIRKSQMANIRYNAENWIYKLQGSGIIDADQTVSARNLLDELIADKTISTLKKNKIEIVAALSVLLVTEISPENVLAPFDDPTQLRRHINKVISKSELLSSRINAAEEFRIRRVREYISARIEILDPRYQVKIKADLDKFSTLFARKQYRTIDNLLGTLLVYRTGIDENLLGLDEFKRDVYTLKKFGMIPVRKRPRWRVGVRNTRIRFILEELPHEYAEFTDRIKQYMGQLDEFTASKHSQTVKLVLMACIYDTSEFSPSKIAKDLGISTLGFLSTYEKIAETGVFNREVNIVERVEQYAKDMGYSLNGNVKRVTKRYPQVFNLMKNRMEMIFIITLHLTKEIDMLDGCKLVTVDNPRINYDKLRYQVYDFRRRWL